VALLLLLLLLLQAQKPLELCSMLHLLLQLHRFSVPAGPNQQQCQQGRMLLCRQQLQQLLLTLCRPATGLAAAARLLVRWARQLQLPQLEQLPGVLRILAAC
jgi:hypothetical protein